MSRWTLALLLASCTPGGPGGPHRDGDLDGVPPADGDCNDQDDAVFPGAAEVPYNGIDDDCADGDLNDVDDDGFVAVEAGGDDCDDDDVATYPGAPTIAGDGRHNDCAGGDRFGVPRPPPADVLFIVDNSSSMGEEQRILGETMPSFVESLQSIGVDWHIGMITTDAESGRGHLVQEGNVRYADRDLPDAVSILQAMTQVGSSGAADERGRRSAWLALRDPALSTENAGFRRDGADLHLVVLSDEPDYSGNQPSQAEFVSFLNDFQTSDNKVTFSSIVGPRGGCPTAEPGVGYIDVTQAVGGYLASICDTSWDAVFDGLHDELTEARATYYVLSEAHVPGTLRATATQGPATYFGYDADAIPAGSTLASVCAECAFTLQHVPETNSVLFSPSPPADSEVLVTYAIP